MEFKVGFNDSSGNYWLGNDLLSQLTLTGRYKLRFDLQSRNHSYWYYAEYSTFRVLPEADNYALHVTGYTGNAGYDAINYQNGMMFSTHDRDNDPHPTRHCAMEMAGGFWYKDCGRCEVNSAQWGLGGKSDFTWDHLPGGGALRSSRMWLQCK